MITSLLVLAVGAVLVQWVAFVPAYLMRSERFYDLTGSLTYLSLVVLALALAPGISARAWLLSVCVVVWAVRLGVFLTWRVRRAGHDRRFDELKHSAPRFLVAWTLQGVWAFLTPLPVWLVVQRPVSGWSPLDGIGLALWGLGFALEIVADVEKSRFKADPSNQGQFIASGTWSLSRHPNYLGEILLWTGVFIVASSQLQGLEWLGFVSPLFVTLLLVKVSGIPLLEASADARWGGDADYETYKQNTAILVPGVY